MTLQNSPITPGDLVARLAAQAGQARVLIALAGPPGAGKTTLADRLCDALADCPGCRPAVLPMDGYHYDDAILTQRGLRPRKGSPDTFDVAGFHHMLTRLRRNDEPEVAVPVFDRTLEISRAGGRIIPASVNLLIVEGNYLLLDRPGWRDLAGLFDLSVALRVSEEELRRRLVERWRGHGVPEADIPAKVEANDLPNGLTVLNESRPADYVLAG